MYDPVSSTTGIIPSQDERPAPTMRAGQLPGYLRRGRSDATPLLTGDHPIPAATGIDREPEYESLADRYFEAEPIDVNGDTVYPLYSELVPTPASTLWIGLLSATPPTELAGIGIGLSMIGGAIDLTDRYLGGVDIWRDALERGITVDLAADSPDALFTLTPVWTDTAGAPQSWAGNYGIVVERTETGRTVLWCSMGAGPPHFADLVIEIRCTPLDPHPRLFRATQSPVRNDPAETPPLDDRDRNLLVDTVEQMAPLASEEGRPADPAAPEGYPCSFADLVLDRSDAEGTAPAPTVTTVDIAAAGSDAPLTERPARARGEADSDPPPYRSGRHAWVESPDTTGLVPVIRGTDLPDYGPDPYRAADQAGAPDPVSVPEPADHRDRLPDDGPGTCRTVADDALTPASTVMTADTAPDPHRLHHLGAVAAARGDTERAGLLWTRAARAGSTGAAYDLGMLYLRHNDPDTAERWWRAAAGRRMIRAMADLSQLLEQRGAAAEARMWRTQAVAEDVIAKAARTQAQAGAPGAETDRFRDFDTP